MLEFRDSTGSVWEVFEVKRSAATLGGVSTGREGGWLSFHDGRERRRLAPVPSGWSTSSPETLITLLDSATVVGAWRTPGPDVSRIERRAIPREVPPTSLDHVIRTAAVEARQAGDAVVAALVRLRATLMEHGVEGDSAEFRAARKLFLDVFYFAPRS